MNRLEAAQWLREAKGNGEALEMAIAILEGQCCEKECYETIATSYCPNCGAVSKSVVQYCPHFSGVVYK